MKRIIISIDFENWDSIFYLDKYNFKSTFNYCELVLPFFEYLKEQNIPATVFIVGKNIAQNIETIKKIKALGFEIACHTFNHKQLNLEKDEEFENELIDFKHKIKDIGIENVDGFRAPSFSMTEKKLEILWKQGFLYDASFVEKKTNEFSNVANLEKYTSFQENIYEKDSHFVFKMPFTKLFFKKIPIGGGGHFRLWPFFIYKHLVNKYFKSSDLFIFYIHPFEIAGNITPDFLKKIKVKDKIRMQLGRKNCFKKFKKTISYWKKKGYEFTNFSQYISLLKNGDGKNER